jgi:epsilon-lactone hydrolase
MIRLRVVVQVQLVGMVLIGSISTIASAQTKPSSAQPGATNIDHDGMVHATNVSTPLSSFESEAAKSAFLRFSRHTTGIPDPKDISSIRAMNESYAKVLDAEMKDLYPISIETKTIGGVQTEVITPRSGISESNRHRVLISLHGGAFMWGEGSEAEVESIPIASLGRITVVVVNYRLAPENHFPAASEDVASVYRSLLQQYKPASIGIYGCSAGGILTAEAIAWFDKVNLPMPGAIGTFCGSAAPISGDSVHQAVALTGMPYREYLPFTNVAAVDDAVWETSLPYFSGLDPNNPLIYPISSPTLLMKFPPTLLIAGSRDFTLSSLFFTQRKLTSAGVEAELHVWDGLLHAFFMNPDLPESKEAYDVIVNFFNRHLAR